MTKRSTEPLVITSIQLPESLMKAARAAASKADEPLVWLIREAVKRELQRREEASKG